MGRLWQRLGRRPGGPGLAALLALVLPLHAADVRLDAAAPDDVARDLRSGSLVLAAEADAAPQDLLAAARAEYANLLGILYRHGHYGGVISILVDGREVAGLSPFTVPAAIGSVQVRVDAGPVFRFGRAEIGPLAPRTELPDGFRPGGRAGSQVVRDAVGAAVDGWREVGHAKARPGDRRIVAVHPEQRLDATIAILPGRLLRFGRLSVDGNVAVREDRIRDIAGFPSGRVFAPDAVETVARRLRNTGAFRSVSIVEAETENPDGSLDFALSLVEDKPRRFGAGVEIASFEGVSLSAYWMHRNLLGGAERLRFDAEVKGIGGESGGLDWRIAGTFSRPGTFSAANTLTLGFELAELDEPDFRTSLAKVQVGLRREISERLEYTFGIGYQYSEVSDDVGDRTFSLFMVPMTARFDGRDEPLNPSEGSYLRLEATPFAGFNQQSGLRLYGDGRHYRSFGERVTLAWRLQLGSITGAGITGTPPEMLFFSGGGGTVRGQPYQSLNVAIDGGETGGRNLIVASAEARVKTGRKLSVVGFYDWGFVGSGQLPGEDGASHAGAGLGLRYDTTLGPIRLDVATPVSGATGDGVQVYIGIGQAF
jgi:translocation and assembly module TamA